MNSKVGVSRSWTVLAGTMWLLLLVGWVLIYDRGKDGIIPYIGWGDNLLLNDDRLVGYGGDLSSVDILVLTYDVRLPREVRNSWRSTTVDRDGWPIRPFDPPASRHDRYHSGQQFLFGTISFDELYTDAIIRRFSSGEGPHYVIGPWNHHRSISIDPILLPVLLSIVNVAAMLVLPPFRRGTMRIVSGIGRALRLYPTQQHQAGFPVAPAVPSRRVVPDDRV